MGPSRRGKEVGLGVDEMSGNLSPRRRDSRVSDSRSAAQNEGKAELGAGPSSPDTSLRRNAQKAQEGRRRRMGGHSSQEEQTWWPTVTELDASLVVPGCLDTVRDRPQNGARFRKRRNLLMVREKADLVRHVQKSAYWAFPLGAKARRPGDAEKSVRRNLQRGPERLGIFRY